MGRKWLFTTPSVYPIPVTPLVNSCAVSSSCWYPSKRNTKLCRVTTCQVPQSHLLRLEKASNGPLGDRRSTSSSLGVCHTGNPLVLPARGSDTTIISNFISAQVTFREQHSVFVVKFHGADAVFPCCCRKLASWWITLVQALRAVGDFPWLSTPERVLHWCRFRYKETLATSLKWGLCSLKIFHLIMP